MFEHMRFGVIPSPDVPLGVSVQWAQEVERLGFDFLGVPDTPLLMREVYVSMAAIALATERIRLAVTVTNPLTRDPSVTAGSILAINDLAPGRLSVGFGSGDSSTHGTGLGGAKMAQIAKYITTIRGLMAGDEVEYHGRRLKAAWNDWEPWDIQLLWAAHGEKSLYHAGRVANSVISGFGLLPETIARAEELIRNGAADAGRDPHDVRIWYRAHVSPGETVEDGFLRSNMASAYQFSRNGFEGKLVPVDLQDAIAQVASRFSLRTHSRANPEALEIAKRTGVLDYLVARAGGLIGPVDYTAQVEQLRNWGVENLIFVALGDDKRQVIRDLAHTVVGLRGGADS